MKREKKETKRQRRLNIRVAQVFSDGRLAIFQTEAIGKCAFCGLHLESVSDGVTETFGLVHQLPVCETFNKLEVPEFIRASAQKLGMSPGSHEEN